jgi:GTP cyclohydrolase I
VGGSPFTGASIPSHVAYLPGNRTLGAAQMSSIVQRLGSKMQGQRVSERDSERVIERVPRGVAARPCGLLRNSAECRL